MVEHLDEARESVQRASEIAEQEVLRKQLRSIDEGLMEMTEPAKTAGHEPHEDTLEEVEQKLTGLLDETDGETAEQIREARDAIDAYRQAYTIDG